MGVLASFEGPSGDSTMSKRNLTFICQNCGAAFSRWQGKCEACGEWNTLVEEVRVPAPSARGSASSRRTRVAAVEIGRAHV